MEELTCGFLLLIDLASILSCSLVKLTFHQAVEIEIVADVNSRVEVHVDNPEDGFVWVGRISEGDQTCSNIAKEALLQQALVDDQS